MVWQDGDRGRLMETKSLKKIGLVGVFENYQKRATGPTFLTSPGYEYGHIKNKLVTALNDLRELAYVHDSYYVHPAATTFGVNKLETGLSYLYTSLSNVLERMSRDHSVFIFQSVIDLYAEIMMNHNRQKWLEPLIEREVTSYDMLVYISLKDQNHEHKNVLAAERYEVIVRKLIQHFKGNHVQVKSVEEANTTIRSLWKI